MTGIAWNQAVQNNENGIKSFFPEKYYFVRVPKIAAFSSINADVLSQKSLNSVYLFF